MSLVTDIIAKLLTDLRTEFAVETFIEVEYGQKFDEPEMDIRIRLSTEENPDSINKTNMTELGPLGAPTHEIGGGIYWRRRMFIQTAFFIDEDDRNVARAQAVDYESRILKVVKRLSVQTTDPNESFIQAIPTKSYIGDTADGPYIWRGQTHMEVLTFLV